MPQANTKRSDNTGNWAHKSAVVGKAVRSKFTGVGKRGLAELGELFEDAGNHYLDIADEIRMAILRAKGTRSARKVSKRKSAKS